jgi:hypothetical protein
VVTSDIQALTRAAPRVVVGGERWCRARPTVVRQTPGPCGVQGGGCAAPSARFKARRACPSCRWASRGTLRCRLPC